MKNITIGTIREKQEGENIVYVTNFYDGFLKEEFYSKDDLFDFITKEGKALFSTGENYKAAIKYINIEKFEHYFLIKKSDEKLIIGEQSTYEFNEAQAYLFKPDVNRRVVNDRYYNFSDMVRSAANFKTTIMWLKVFLLIVTGIVSTILLIDTLDFTGNSSRGAGIKDKSIYQVFSLANVSLSAVFSFIGAFALYYAIKVFKEENEQANYFSFRTATRWRQRYRILNLLLQLTAMSFIISFAWRLNADGHYAKWDSLAILLTINAILLGLTIMAQIFYISSVYINLHKVVRKYFKNIEYKVFWKWYRTGEPQDLQGSNDIFYLAFEDSSLLYTREYEIASELIRTDTRKELKSFSAKQKEHISNAVWVRKEKLKKVK